MSAATAPRALRGEPNRAAAEHLMTGAHRRLMALARRSTRCPEDAEDAFGRTVELALRSCPIERDTDQVERWARVVLRREAGKIARRYRRKPAYSLDGQGARSGDFERPERLLADRHQASPEEHALDAETMAEVYAAIELLPPDQRCVIDGYANGWTTQEIADALGLTHRQARRLLWKGMRALRLRLGGTISALASTTPGA